MHNKTNNPINVGIIMDGNGRWANRRLLPRSGGHAAGAKTLKKLLDDCVEMNEQGILNSVALYAFSTENQRRPENEVTSLVKLFDKYLDEMKVSPQKKRVVKFIGDLTFFPESLQKKAKDVEKETENNTGLKCFFALNYGGRAEILKAAKDAFKDNVLNTIDEEKFGEYLYTKQVPDFDLIIRTAGEKRLSNFLLWQAAYAEFVFTDALFPDFDKKELQKCIEEFNFRKRNFGKV